MAWRPILEGADAARARTVISALADDVAAAPLDDAGLASGAAGFALLHGWLARDGDERAAERCHDALGHVLGQLTAGLVESRGLWTGTAGIGWALHALRDVVEIDDDTLDVFDVLTGEVLANGSGDYELMTGLVGLGVHAQARGRSDDVARTVAHLDRLAERTPDGLTWWSTDPLDGCVDPRGYHNLGLAHGVAGAVAFLGGAGAHALAGEGARWLLAQQGVGAPRFPILTGAPVPPASVRNGWCYGDLAIATALVRAGETERGLALARAAADDPIDDVGELGVSLCHGTAGRAHLLGRLAEVGEDRALFAASRRYHLATMERLATASLTPAFRNGATGVALALLAAISPLAPSWDRVLLVS